MEKDLKSERKTPPVSMKLRKKIQKAEMIVFQKKLYLQENRSTGRKTFV